MADTPPIEPTGHIWIVMFYDYEQTCFGAAFDNKAAADAYAEGMGTVERHPVWSGTVPTWSDWSGWVHVLPNNKLDEYRVVKNTHDGEPSPKLVTAPRDYFYHGTQYAFEVSGPTEESVRNAIEVELTLRGCTEWKQKEPSYG